MADAGMGNPFALLTFLAAPALLTNAAALMIFSTSNRLARASDRARTLAIEVRRSEDHTSPEFMLNTKLFRLAAERTEHLVKALSALYLALASFAAGTGLALAGSVGVAAGAMWVERLTLVAAGPVAAVGIAAFALSAGRLFRESGMALEGIRMEQELVRGVVGKEAARSRLFGIAPPVTPLVTPPIGRPGAGE